MVLKCNLLQSAENDESKRFTKSFRVTEKRNKGKTEQLNSSNKRRACQKRCTQVKSEPPPRLQARQRTQLHHGTRAYGASPVSAQVEQLQVVPRAARTLGDALARNPLHKAVG